MILCRETGKTKPQKTKEGDDGTYYRMAVGMSENAIEWMVVSCFVPTKRANITNSMDFFAFHARLHFTRPVVLDYYPHEAHFTDVVANNL